MASEKYILVRPPQLPELANIQAGAYVVGYNTATDQTVKINVSALGGGQETDISWRANITYATGNIVEYGLKLWKSLIDDNLGNFPTEGANWTEVSKAGAGSNITNYTTGVYTYDPTIVLREGRIYYLLAEKPFESTDFIAELEANQWREINRSNLIGVDTQGNDYFFPFLGDTVIVLYATSIGIENGEETVFTLTVPQPSYVIRTGTGYTAGDFTILPIGGGGGGHVFEDQSGTALPTRSVAKAGAGIEFEDDDENEMTVVKLKGYIQPISFAITDTFTFKPALALSITSADVSANISDLRVGKNGATPTTITYPYPIIASDVLTFEVSFTDAYNRELSSFINLIGQYV